VALCRTVPGRHQTGRASCDSAILDLTCGAGAWLKRLHDAGYRELWGIDRDAGGFGGADIAHFISSDLDGTNLIDQLQTTDWFIYRGFDLQPAERALSKPVAIGDYASCSSSSLPIIASAASLRCSSDARARSSSGSVDAPLSAVAASAVVSSLLTWVVSVSNACKRPASSRRTDGTKPTMAASQRAVSAGHVSLKLDERVAR
jgi:hypothetical protein